MNTQNSKMDRCGCCEGIEWLTPERITNDHGQTSLFYRIGTHGPFKESMLQSLSRKIDLKDLTSRENDDPSIALFDVWAMILDVLTFYNERIINEGYLLTSTERLSLVELAKHIGYVPKPGVAANTWFKFQTEDTPGAPVDVNVPMGTRVLSIPAQDERSQIFESIENIRAKTKWNKMFPKLTEKQTFEKGVTTLYLAGTDNQVNIGDKILLVGSARLNNPESERWDFRTVDRVTLDDKENRTELSWKEGLGHDNPIVQPADDSRVFVFRQRAALFGFNAPDFRSMSQEVKDSYTKEDDTDATEWPNFEIKVTDKRIFLDTLYPRILKSSWLVLTGPNYTELYKAIEVKSSAQNDFLLASKSSEVIVDTNENLNTFQRRETVVYAQSEELTLTNAPILDDIKGDTIQLSRAYPELEKGMMLVITGELIPEEVFSPDQDLIVSELIEIKEIYQLTNTLLLKDPLEHKYQRSSVTITANISQATHGETKVELLGSGNASIPFQRFFLKQKPLTYISSSYPKGIASSLEIRVDGIKWEEVSTFYKRTSEERIYITRTENDGKTYVRFGNGITGMRLPSGQENIKATYRVGIGMEALLKANQLSMLLDPQLGLKSVTNPLPTTGAEDPESFKNIKNNAPLTVLTLDRIVSVNDFENFTSAFAGIGKARADLLWKGENRTLHLTVAAADQGPIDNTLKGKLEKAINEARHDNYPVIINSFEEHLFTLKSKIKIHPDYLQEDVIGAVKDSLFENYSFKNRSFAQSATPSELITTIQSVDGVIAVDLDELNGINPFTIEHFRLISNKARWNVDEIKPAQLLLIDKENIEITIMT